MDGSGGHTGIALAAGYNTRAALGKAFKQQFGIGPGEFRQPGCRTSIQLSVKG